MNRILIMLIAALFFPVISPAQSAPDAIELTKLVKDFLDGASRNDASMHDRFWADDLIYTGSAGRRIGKADIMRDQRGAQAPRAGAPTTTYTAEDLRIQQYGTTAIVAFRLVSTTTRASKIDTANFLNTGTFLKRNGKWQAVSWQATRMPASEEATKKEIAIAEASFHKALLAADLTTIESLVDESFIWTHRAGEQMTRRQLLDDLRSGRLKYSRLETNNVAVSLYGDTAVVRGVSPVQRTAIPGESGGDVAPFTAYYTLIFANRGGQWKAVAMHSSRS